MTSKRTFSPKGLLALAQTAYGADYEKPAPAATSDGPIAVVEVRGPLMHHADLWFDSYEAVVARVRAALAEKPSHLVLALDSPGGLVSGCFEAAADIRQLAQDAGVPVTAYVDGIACSAAYALACAAARIVVPPTGAVGSVGVLDALVSQAGADAASGLSIRLISSGRRKTDGHPHTPITDDAEAEAQRHVDYLAGLFFELVASARGVSAAEVAALQAAVEIGAAAVEKKLADEVISFSALVARLEGESAPTTPTEDTKMDELEAAIALLKELAGKDDGEAAGKAKKMLGALEAPADEEKDETKDEPVAAAKASDEVKDLESAAKAISRLNRRMDDDRRSTLLASRPDLGAETVAVLQAAPIDVVEKMVKALPRTALKTPITTVAGTRGAGETDRPSAASAPDEKAVMDRIMGVTRTQPGVAHVGNRIVLGAPVARKDK